MGSNVGHQLGDVTSGNPVAPLEIKQPMVRGSEGLQINTAGFVQSPSTQVLVVHSETLFTGLAEHGPYMGVDNIELLTLCATLLDVLPEAGDVRHVWDTAEPVLKRLTAVLTLAMRI